MRDTPSWSETMVYDVEFKSVNQLMSTQVPVARHWIAQNVQIACTNWGRLMRLFFAPAHACLCLFFAPRSSPCSAWTLMTPWTISLVRSPCHLSFASVADTRFLRTAASWPRSCYGAVATMTSWRLRHAGTFNFDLGEVWAEAGHEYYRQWVALTIAADDIAPGRTPGHSALGSERHLAKAAKLSKEPDNGKARPKQRVEGVQGYLKVSVAIVPEKKERNTIHDGHIEDTRVSSVLVPPTIELEGSELQVSCHQAEGQR